MVLEWHHLTVLQIMFISLRKSRSICYLAPSSIIFHSITHPDVFGAIKMSNLLPNPIGFECQHVFFACCIQNHPSAKSLAWYLFQQMAQSMAQSTKKTKHVGNIGSGSSGGSVLGHSMELPLMCFFSQHPPENQLGSLLKKTPPQTKQIRFKYVCSEFCVYVLIHV